MAIVHGYCSLSSLKERLDISHILDQDALLESAISAVSRTIDAYCRRRFYAATETRYYTAARRDHLLVDDLLSVTTLKTDAADRTYPTTWSSTDYDPYPFNGQVNATAAERQPYWRIDVTPNGVNCFPIGVPKGVQIVGSWGYGTSAPADVEHACVYQSAIVYRAKDFTGGSLGQGIDRQEIQTLGLHPFTRRLLDPYRRRSVGR